MKREKYFFICFSLLKYNLQKYFTVTSQRKPAREAKLKVIDNLPKKSYKGDKEIADIYYNFYSLSFFNNYYCCC